MANIHRALDVVGDGESATDVEIRQSNIGVALDFPSQVQQSLQSNLVRGELRDLGPDVHIEPEQSNVLQPRRDLCNGECLVERYPELHPLLTRACVRVRRVYQDLGVYAQRDWSDDAKPLRHIVEYVQLLLGFHIDEEYFGRASSISRSVFPTPLKTMSRPE